VGMGRGGDSDGGQRWSQRLAAAFRRPAETTDNQPDRRSRERISDPDRTDHPARDSEGQRDHPTGWPGHHQPSPATLTPPGDGPQPDRIAQEATASENGVIQQAARDLINNNYTLPARPIAKLPFRAGLTPPRAAAFQHRDTTQLVEQAAVRGDTVVLTSEVTTSVLSGLGGVGKTQLAIDYAETLWAAQELDLLVWVTAGTREAIVSTYADVGESVVGVRASDPETGARRLLEWLSTTTSRWLVVLDDLQAPEHLNGLWPPSTSTGRVVVTTRRRDASLRGHRRQVINVDVFTPAEAGAYLASAFSDQPALLDGADQLAAELGFLPLALAQAAAYALDRGLSCAGYLTRFTDRQRTLSALLPQPDRDGLPDGHQATVAATWSLSIERANNLTPVGLAGPLLEITSVLDANGIPTAVFTSDAAVRMLTARVNREVTPEEAQDGLGCLHRLSLIALDSIETARSVRVHALVQRAVRDTISAADMPVVAKAAADALLDAWPEVERDTTFVQVLRTNVETLANVAEQHLWSGEGHPVLFRVGTSMGNSGLVGEACKYFSQLQEAADERLGPEHPDTLTTRSNIARYRGRAGDPAAAKTAYEQLLTDQLRVLGPDHPDTLTTRHQIAYSRGQLDAKSERS